MFLFGCLTFEKTNAWLNSQKGVPKINISGDWDAGSIFAGWGSAIIVQKGNEFYGTLGLYNIKGVINGDNIYYILTSGSKIYYTGSLKYTQSGNLEGLAVEKAIVDTEGAVNATKYPLIMKKVDKTKK